MANAFTYEELSKLYLSDISQSQDAALHVVADLAQMLAANGYEYISWNKWRWELSFANVANGPRYAICAKLNFEKDDIVELLELNGYVLKRIADVPDGKTICLMDKDAGWANFKECISMVKFDRATYSVKNLARRGNTRYWRPSSTKSGLQRFADHMGAFVNLVNEWRDCYIDQELADYFTRAEKHVVMWKRQFTDEIDELAGGSIAQVKFLFGNEGCAEHSSVYTLLPSDAETISMKTKVFIGNSTQRHEYYDEPRIFNTTAEHFCKIPDFLSLRLPDSLGPRVLSRHGEELSFSVTKTFSLATPKDATYAIWYSRFADFGAYRDLLPHSTCHVFRTHCFAELFDYIDACFEYEQTAYKLAAQQATERKRFVANASWFADHKDAFLP